MKAIGKVWALALLAGLALSAPAPGRGEEPLSSKEVLDHVGVQDQSLFQCQACGRPVLEAHVGASPFNTQHGAE